MCFSCQSSDTQLQYLNGHRRRQNQLHVKAKKKKKPPHDARRVCEEVKQGGRGLVSVRVTLQDETRITGYIVTGCKI